MYETVQGLKEIRECIWEEKKEVGWKKWIQSVWNAQMIQKHEQHNPEHKNKGLWLGITILEFCHLIVEKKENKWNKKGMWSRLLGVGFGRHRKRNEQ